MQFANIKEKWCEGVKLQLEVELLNWVMHGQKQKRNEKKKLPLEEQNKAGEFQWDTLSSS